MTEKSISELWRELAEHLQRVPPERMEQLERELDEMTNDILREKLKSAIDASGRAPAAIAWEAGIEPSQVYRFLQGSEIKLATASALAQVLELELVPRRRRSRN